MEVEEGPGTNLAWAKMVQQESDVCPVMSGACCLLANDSRWWERNRSQLSPLKSKASEDTAIGSVKGDT